MRIERKAVGASSDPGANLEHATPAPPLREMATSPVSNAPYMTDDEVEGLTGYVQPKRQMQWLQQNGIKANLNARGKVRVPRDAYTARPGTAKPVVRTEPDFSRVRKAS